ncbi:50S ribosomal protein L32 [Candidatus Kaiserbacteria bacterium RIFCSPHIGHO2_02_FULL_49_11]|uniref:Large ribosomal subunit protein bL32 n=1 Tax=Candidatus Kaiserbacteria bacterium RIFCSPHIGHO2_02_FULL_49_11 TaxID=1798489 RepID=A0A1F6D0X6_9BACT|nr:MAG: 50S ribosomal protein L32 [Candidatus Kaiserbacteria bacterium RIFCSPHIGHO2_02_FULL_49_11]
MSVRMRHTRAHTANRRSHHAIQGPRVSSCANCKAPMLRHRACVSCGQYRGRVVTDVAAKAQKKEVKRKARAKDMGGETSSKEEKLVAEEKASK